MKITHQVAMIIATAALLPAPVLPGLAQAPAPEADDRANAAKARRIAEQFERDARVLTVFDRQGKVVTTVGERAIYNTPVFSPDRTRLAVIKRDLGSRTEDLWVLDVATGNSTRITSNQRDEERVKEPVWSPDGSQVAYVALRRSYQGLYRKASNGEGTEELLYQHPGFGMTLADWSMDGRFLSFFVPNLSGGTVYALPLGGDGERTPIEVFRSESQVRGPRLSPDSRFLSYGSDQSGKNEVYVRPFDPSAGAGATPAAEPWQVSDQGGQGMAFWRQDGKELYYVAAERGVMVVEVSTAPTFEFGKPKLLLRLPEAVPVTPGAASVSRDGQRIVIAVPPVPTLTLQQITVFDRQGNVLSKVGAPGRYVNPALSPDGTRVAVVRTDPRTSNVDIWTFEVASGKGTAVTNDTSPENFPIWSPDGRQVAYVSRGNSFASIYRKAWDGTGNEEQLFGNTPGGDPTLTDWSVDGKFLAFHDGCGGGAGVLLVGPLSGDQKALERKEIEWLREEYEVAQGRFSPDSRFMAYLSNEIEVEIFEVYVRPFDASKADVSAGGAKPAQVSNAGALGMIFWRQDGKELYYLTPDSEVMAVDVTTTPTFQAGTPRLLFKLPGPLVGNPQQWKNVSRDGQRFAFAINVPASVTAR